MAESEIQRDTLDALEAHGDVVWVKRINSGTATRGGRWIPFGFVGCPDIHGMHACGAPIYIETKDLGGEERKKQVEFIDLVKPYGARAGFARSVQEAIDIVEGRG